MKRHDVARLLVTVYDDMRRMEDLASGSDADRAILRPSGLVELPAVTRCSLTEADPGRLSLPRPRGAPAVTGRTRAGTSTATTAAEDTPRPTP